MGSGQSSSAGSNTSPSYSRDRDRDRERDGNTYMTAPTTIPNSAAGTTRRSGSADVNTYVPRHSNNRSTSRRDESNTNGVPGLSSGSSSGSPYNPSSPVASAGMSPTGNASPTPNHLVLNNPYEMERSDTLNTVQAEDAAAAYTPRDHDDNLNLHNSNHNRHSAAYTNDDDHTRSTGYMPSSLCAPATRKPAPHHAPAASPKSSSPASRPLRKTVGNAGSSFRTPPPNSGGPLASNNSNSVSAPAAPVPCLNLASDVNARLDTQVEVRVYPCNNNSGSGGKKKFTQFTVKPEGVIIQGTNRNRSVSNDLGAEYATHIGRKLQRYELSDTRACQLLVTTHNKSFWVVPAPEAFSRHSGTCRLLGDRKHPLAPHTLQVGDFLRVGSVGVVVIETHNGVENRILSEEKIQKIMKDTSNSNGNFLDLGETDGENSDDSVTDVRRRSTDDGNEDAPVCYMCFDDENTDENPLITPCKCRGDTRYVHVGCLRKWHTAETDNQICFLSSVDATCSVCKSTFKSDFKLRDGRLVKLFKSSLEPPYVSLLVATKHEMAQRLFNTRFQLSFSTLMKPDGRNGTRPLILGRSSASDMVLDYRTVSARHATIKFKNGEFIFTDAQSSNGSYLYLRRPVELTVSQSVQFRLGRSMISMKVVNKWNRRLLRAVRRSGQSSCSSFQGGTDLGDDHSVGSNENDVRISDGRSGNFTRTLPRRSRESIMNSLPAPGMLSQQSSQHIDLLHALAYPKRNHEKENSGKKKDGTGLKRQIMIEEPESEESKMEEYDKTTSNIVGNNSHFVTSGEGEVARLTVTNLTDE